MIEKKIHYCWFGGNELPTKAKRCIKSWKKYFPDYEIIEWNEKNFDINFNNYAKEAYLNKKYALKNEKALYPEDLKDYQKMLFLQMLLGYI